MINILNKIDSVAQRISNGPWNRLLRHVDRYFRAGRHHDHAGAISGYALIVREQTARKAAISAHKIAQHLGLSDDTITFATWKPSYGH